MLVQHRYSETDFVAYLLALGFKYDKIETCKSTKSGKKTFAYFTGEEEELIRLQNDFHSGHAIIYALEFAKQRRIVAKKMRESFIQFKSNNE
jgi:hypothetical protein